MIHCLKVTSGHQTMFQIDSHYEEIKMSKSQSLEEKIAQIEIETTKLKKKYSKSNATNQSIGKNKQISLKMRKKLLGWLEKLAIETFQFKTQTYFLCVQILDEYLALTNQTPKQLQMIGCASMLLASKQTEQTIVSSQCYMTACKDLFTVKELQEKQMVVFETLNWNISFFPIPRLLTVYCNGMSLSQSLSISKATKENLLKILQKVLKHEVYVLATQKLFFEVLLTKLQISKVNQNGKIGESQNEDYDLNLGINEDQVVKMLQEKMLQQSDK